MYILRRVDLQNPEACYTEDNVLKSETRHECDKLSLENI